MQTRTCGRCGYDLVGIAAAGRCPECGQAYDLASGQGTDARRVPWVLRHGRTASLVGLAVFILGCSGLLSLAARNKMAMVLSGLMVAAVVGLGAVMSYLSEQKNQRDADGG